MRLRLGLWFLAFRALDLACLSLFPFPPLPMSSLFGPGLPPSPVTCERLSRSLMLCFRGDSLATPLSTWLLWSVTPHYRLGVSRFLYLIEPQLTSSSSSYSFPLYFDSFPILIGKPSTCLSPCPRAGPEDLSVLPPSLKLLLTAIPHSAHVTVFV